MKPKDLPIAACTSLSVAKSAKAATPAPSCHRMGMLVAASPDPAARTTLNARV